MTMFSRIFAAAAVAFLFGAAVVPSSAQTYPSRPVRLIVPYPPGSGTDIVARILAQKLSEQMGQQFIVENKPGAGATLGTEQVAKADPDGHTLLMADVGPLAIAPSAFARLPYTVSKDFAPVSQVAVLPFLLVVHPSVPAKSVPELVAYAKAHPTELNYASVGNGTAVHLATELFKQLTEVDIKHVPYRGSAPALTDLVAGRVSVMFVNVLSAMSFVNGGQLRALAIGSSKRSEALPDVPTFAELSMASFDAGVWFGILAPAGAPPAIVQKLNAEIVRALELPEVRAKLAQQGGDVAVSTPEEFASKIRAEGERWAEVIKRSGVHVE